MALLNKVYNGYLNHKSVNVYLDDHSVNHVTVTGLIAPIISSFPLNILLNDEDKGFLSDLAADKSSSPMPDIECPGHQAIGSVSPC